MNDVTHKTEEGHACGSCQGIMWWVTLVMAVLAVPAFGVMVAFSMPFEGLGMIIIFVLACWGSTYLGMKLMQDPRMSRKVVNKK